MVDLNLQEKLTKAIFAYQVRNKLTQFGIPENEQVQLILRANNKEPLATVDIPTTEKKDHIQKGSLSIESFKQVIKDEFLNGAINTLDLQIAEDSLELIFTTNSGTNIALSVTCCCTIQGYCCCFC